VLLASLAARAPSSRGAAVNGELVSQNKATHWRDVDERGRLGLIRALAFVATGLGRGPARIVLRFLALYYTLFFAKGRRAVQHFLRRVGRMARWRDVYSTVFRFAQVSLDALYLLRGQFDRFDIHHHGHDNLQALKREGRGAVLLGAHLGSFYAMRAKSRDRQIPIYPVVYTHHAQRYNAVLQSIAKDANAHVISMADGDVGFILRVRKLVEQGGLVAILADRVPKGGRSADVDFLGER